MEQSVLRFIGLAVVATGCMAPVEEDLASVSQEVAYGDHDYLFVMSPKTWLEAQTYCATYDGGSGYHLVTINDAGEEAFLNTAESNRSLTSSWWIGYTDAGIEGFWIWDNGTSTFSNWAPGEPNGLEKYSDCAIDRSNATDQWNDVPCTNTYFFVCERDGSAPPSQGNFFYSTTNTNSATQNQATYSLFLNAGQVFTMGTCGLPGASGLGDTYLRLMNPSGVQVAANNNSGGSCGLLSNTSVFISTSGTHTIHAGCFSSTSCSGSVAWNY